MNRFILFASCIVGWVCLSQTTTVNLSFRTLDEMRAFTVTAYQTNLNGTVVDLLRGGNFRYTPSTALATNDGIIYSAAGAGGRWVRQYDDALAAAWWGVEVDNTVNQATRLSTALQYAINNGKQLRLPPGRVYLTANVTAESTNTSWGIVGQGTTLYFVSPGGTPSVLWITGTNSTPTNVFIGNFRIETPAATKAYAGINWEAYAKGLTFQNLDIVGTEHDGIKITPCGDRLASRIRDVTIDNCHFHEVPMAMGLYQFDGMKVTHCTVLEGALDRFDHAIYMGTVGQPCTNAFISDFYAEGDHCDISPYVLTGLTMNNVTLNAVSNCVDLSYVTNAVLNNLQIRGTGRVWLENCNNVKANNITYWQHPLDDHCALYIIASDEVEFNHVTLPSTPNTSGIDERAVQISNGSSNIKLTDWKGYNDTFVAIYDTSHAITIEDCHVNLLNPFVGYFTAAGPTDTESVVTKGNVVMYDLDYPYSEFWYRIAGSWTNGWSIDDLVVMTNTVNLCQLWGAAGNAPNYVNNFKWYNSTYVHNTIGNFYTTPEANVIGMPGDLMTVTNGTMYLKETGTGNTGWSQVLTASGAGGPYVLKAGDTMSGPLLITNALGVAGTTFAVNTNSLVAQGGNVGVGIATPDAKLRVLQDVITDPQPALSVSGTWNDGADTFYGAVFNFTNTASAIGFLFDFQLAGSSKLSLDKSSVLRAAGNILGSGNIQAGTSSSFYWPSKTKITSATDGYADFSNYAVTDFLGLRFGGTTATYPALFTYTNAVLRGGTSPYLAVRTADGGSFAPLYSGTHYIDYNPTGLAFAVNTNQLVVTNGYVGIGTATPSRQLSITGNEYVGGTIESAGTYIFFVSKSRIASGSDGYFDLYNNAAADFLGLRFGGTASAYPALFTYTNNSVYLSTARPSLAVKKADGSDWASLVAHSIYLDDTNSTAGNVRGVGAVDLQSGRNAATKVASGTASAILGGTNNTAIGEGSVALGGNGNSTSGTASIVGGGTATVASGANYSFAYGNNVNISSSSSDYSFISGLQAVNTLYGQWTRSSGRHEISGDSQMSILTARRSIEATNAVGYVVAGPGSGKTNDWNPVFLDGDTGTQRLVLPYTAGTQTNAVWVFKAQVAAFATTNYAGTKVLYTGGYTVEGTIKSTWTGARTTAICGSPVVTTLYEDNSAWDVRAVADDTNEALVFEFYPENDCPKISATITLTQLTVGP